jgi:hypothetical protein
VTWGFANLVCDTQFHKQKSNAEYLNPTNFICEILPDKMRKSFSFYSWERLYTQYVADLAAYMYNKSANGVKAFEI